MQGPETVSKADNWIIKLPLLTEPEISIFSSKALREMYRVAQERQRELWKQHARNKLDCDLKTLLQNGITTDEQLKEFIYKAVLVRSNDGELKGTIVPDTAICQGHVSPYQYISDSILKSGRWDKICWANRGGGKTFLGAIATWLDSILYAGCETRILGGSKEQSEKMYNYTCTFWEEAFFRNNYLRDEPSRRGTVLANGSSYSILTASTKSIRGPHVSRVKLDEIDEFDKTNYEAAAYIATTRRGIKACMELFSTMHRPYGLMSEIIDNAAEHGYKLYKWCLFEVLETCTEPLDACQRCYLFEDCVDEQFPNGKARLGNGYRPIEDAINEKKRVSKDSWVAEELCKRATRSGLVYRDYWDSELHVIEGFSIPSEWKRYRSLDFGVENPFVCLYIARSPDDEYFIYDEIYQSGKTSEEWAEIIHKRDLEERIEYEFTTCDPSGKDQRLTFCNHDVIVVSCWNNDIEHGIERVKRLLKVHPARKTPSLRIFSSCTNTIKEFNAYHYPDKKTGNRNVDEKPVDVFNHALDAVRYFASDIDRFSTDIVEGER